MIAEPDLVGHRRGESFVRVLDHPKGITVTGALVVFGLGHCTAQQVPQTEAALKPAPAKAGDVMGGSGRIEREKPVAPAEGKPEGEKLPDLRRRGRRRKSGDTQDTQMHGADPRLEAAVEVPSCEKDVEIARGTRDSDRLRQPCETGVEVTKESRRIEALQLEGTRQDPADLVEPVLERVEDLLPGLSGLLAAEEILEKSRTCIGRWKVGHEADQ